MTSRDLEISRSRDLEISRSRDPKHLILNISTAVKSASMGQTTASLWLHDQ